LRAASILRILPVVVLLAACSCQSAAARQLATLRASFSPDRLGAYATIFVAFEISSIPAGDQVPLTNVSVFLPGEIGLATSGLGLENCLLSRLEDDGPDGCPPDSLMGRGVASAEIPFRDETVVQSAQVDVFSSPVQHGRLALMVFVDAQTPVEAELVFPATLVSASPPYSEGIDTDVPLVPTVPAGPDVAVTRFQMALGSTPTGPDHFVYYRWVHGHLVAYPPRGLLLPPTCPHGGFPFEAQFVFQDETTATARTTVPCPRASHVAPRRKAIHGQGPRADLRQSPSIGPVEALVR
jgi:hypothetical protein